MQKKITPLGVISIVMAIVIVLGLFMMLTGDARYSDDEISALELQAAEEAATQANLEKDLEIAILRAELVAKEEIEIAEAIEEEKISLGYILDELFLGGTFIEDILSDRELITLFDGEVEFNGEDYDAEEVLVLNDLELDANNDDMEGNVYLTLKEGSIKYLFTFEGLDVSEIGEDDEYLTFNLLGKEVSISSWNDDSIVFSQGVEYFMTEGETLTVDGSVVELNLVMDDSVYVIVDGIGGKIDEGETKTINGIDVKANEVLYSQKETVTGKAELLIGEEVEIEANNGEEYAKDSPFEWYIDGDSATIGVILAEDFDELDEDFNALGVEGKLCLPNDYVCLVYDGSVGEDSRDYKIEGDDEETEIYGDFIINDRDSCDDILIRYNVSGDNKYTLWDEENDYENDDDAKILGSIELEDSEYTLSVDEDTGAITFVNVDTTYNIVIPFDVSSITMDGSSIDKDYDYVSDYGVIVSNTEEIDEDLEVSISVPEEQIEYTATLV